MSTIRIFSNFEKISTGYREKLKIPSKISNEYPYNIL